jgi:hypothetical protein
VASFWEPCTRFVAVGLDWHGNESSEGAGYATRSSQEGLEMPLHSSSVLRTSEV